MVKCIDRRIGYMNIVKLFLLFTFVLWSDFKSDIPNNEQFYKEVANVFVQPLYRPINTARFEDMNGTDMSFEMRQSIEEFLPIYLSTKAPLCKDNDNYPTTEIQRFFKVLNKYMAILEFEKRDAEIYEILDKRLSDAHNCIQNATSVLELLYGMVYYENALYIISCKNKVSRQLPRKICDNSKMKTLLYKYNVPDKEYFFAVLQKNRKRDVDMMLSEMKKGGIPSSNLEVLSAEIKRLTEHYYIKYGKKLKNTVVDGSYESLDEYDNYINKELESMQSVNSVAKTILSNISLKIQKSLSINNRYYGNMIDNHVKTMALLMFSSLGNTYVRYQNFLRNYNKLLKSCPQND